MNIIERVLWRWQGKRKLNSDRLGLKYTGIRKLGEIANAGDFEKLLPHLSENNQTIRNAAALALRQIIQACQDSEQLEEFQQQVLDRIDQVTSLPEKLALIEVMRALSLDFREEVLGDMITESQNDLQYAVIQSIEDTRDVDILDDVLEAASTEDLVLRRIALQTWYFGIANQKLDEVLEYITPRLHYLVRAAYELQTDGEFLRNALSYANRQDLPHPKAYPDFMIRYITELLGNWKYDPEAFNSLHAIMVPSYFTFKEEEGKERPYLIL